MAGYTPSIIDILVVLRDNGAGAAIDSLAYKFGALGTEADNLTSKIFSFKSLLEAAFASEVVEGAIKLIEAFAGEELAITRVNAALRVTGRFSEDGSAAIQNMATKMQELTTVSRIAALDVSSTIGQIARDLTTQQLADAQKAAIGLSETFGLSLDRAAILIAKSLEGSTNALQRYGIQVDVTADQQTKFHQIMAQLSPMFQVAVEATHTLSGEFEQAKNAFADVQRSAGEILASFLQLETRGRGLVQVIKDINTWIIANASDITNKLREIVDTALVMGEAVKAGFMIVVGGLGLIFSGVATAITASAEAVVNMVKSVINGVLDLVEEFDAYANLVYGTHLPDSIKHLNESWVATNAMGERTASIFHQIGDAIDDVGDAWTRLKVDMAHPVEVHITGAKGAGAGPNLNPANILDVHAAVTEAAEKVKILDDQFKAGTIGAQEFLDKMKPLKDRIYDLMSVAQGKDLDALVRAFDALSKSSAGAVAALGAQGNMVEFFKQLAQLRPQDQVTALDAVSVSLANTFKAGGISANAFIGQLGPLLEHMRALQQTGGLTAKEAALLEHALKALSGAGADAASEIYEANGNLEKFMQNISKLTPEDQSKALTQAATLIKSAFDAGEIGIQDYTNTTSKLRQALEQLLTAGGLTERQIIAVRKAIQGIDGDTGQSLGSKIYKALIGVDDVAKKATTSVASMASTFQNQLVSGIQSALDAHHHFGETVEKEVGRAAAAQAKLAFANAIEATAHGIIDSFINPGQATKDFAAAATFFEAAAVFGSIAGATGGFSGGGGGGGGGGGAGGGTSGANDSLNANGMGSSVTIVVPATFTNDPNFMDAFAGVLEQLSGRRVSVVTQG